MLKNFALFISCVIALALLSNTAESAVISQSCQNQLQQCTDKLKKLSSSSTFASLTSESDLDSMCPALEDGLACMEDYGFNCLDAVEKERFDEVHSGSLKVINKLCQPGDYRKEYLSYLDCFKTVKDDYVQCTRSYEARIEELRYIEDSDNHTRHMCQAFDTFMGCSGDVVAAKCGDDAAAFTKNMLEQLSGTLEETYCKNMYPSGSRESSESKNSDLDDHYGNSSPSWSPVLMTSFLSLLIVYSLS